MAHIEDRWTKPGPNGRRIRSDRHGNGKRWRAVWTEPGGQRRRASFSTREAAVGHLARVETEQRQGTYVTPSGVTVAEYGARWLTAQLHQRATTRAQLESRWRLHIKPALGHLRLADVTRADVQAAVATWAGSLAPASVGVVFAYTRAVFRSAVEDRLMRESPCVRIRVPQVVRPPVVPLTVAQVQTIAERVAPRYRAMVWLAAATGLRSGELRGLTVDRLLFDGGALRVRVDRQLVTTAPTFGPPKTPTSVRTVSVDEATAQLMLRHLAEHPPHPSGIVFVGREGRPLARSTMTQVWTDATEGMGLRDRAGWHELRHFHASLLIAAGLSPTAVAARLGHKDASETLQTYAHLWEDDESRAIAAVSLALQPPQNPRLTVVAGGGGRG